MLPTLKAFAEGRALATSEARLRIAAAEGLSDEDVRELLPSGNQSAFTNRVSWAIVHMGRAGLLERVRRGVYRITGEGDRLLSSGPSRIDLGVLREYPAYIEWRAKTGPTEPSGTVADFKQNGDSFDTPEEAIDRAAEQLNGELEADLLHRVRSGQPAFFEQVVVDLLVAMGYGGGNATKSRVTGRSGDGGIDGTIREDVLGLDEIYVQAKRYAEGNNVRASDLRDFAGAIDLAGTTKGVFVTTAGFTRDAENYVAKSPKRIILIGGEELARLMVRHGIGVRTRHSYEVKRIDEDYFE